MKDFNQGAHLHLQQLGKPTPIPTSPKEASIETIPNRWPNADYVVNITCEEFTCLCPLTGQPDFANIFIEYRPDELLVESKSLKLYLHSFRNEGTFHEHVINCVLDDIVGALAPRWCKITADFAVRGGIGICVDAEYKK